MRGPCKTLMKETYLKYILFKLNNLLLATLSQIISNADSQSAASDWRWYSLLIVSFCDSSVENLLKLWLIMVRSPQKVLVV